MSFVGTTARDVQKQTNLCLFLNAWREVWRQFAGNVTLLTIWVVTWHYASFGLREFVVYDYSFVNRWTLVPSFLPFPVLLFEACSDFLRGLDNGARGWGFVLVYPWGVGLVSFE